MTVVNPKTSMIGTERLPTSIVWLIVGTAGAFLLSLAIRATYFHAEPITDELYHLLAAQSWVTNGSLSIADGSYNRASLFTKAVGIVYRFWPGDLDAVRWFCIVTGSVLVAAVFAWTYRSVGLIEAFISSVVLAVMPGAIFLSQHIRFYSLHALVFWFAAIWFYALLVKPRTGLKIVPGLAGICALLVVSVHFQVTTLVGVCGLLLWAVILKWDDIRAWTSTRLGKRVLLIVAVLGSILLYLALQSGFVATLADIYFASAEWNSSDTLAYYHNLYKRQFGALWVLFPVFLLIALSTKKPAAGFCASVFLVAFCLQSFGGMRSERYMFYAMPFLAVLWGIALARMGSYLYALSWHYLSEARFAGIGDTARKALARSLVVGMFFFFVISLPAVELSAKMVLGKTQTLYGAPQYWGRYNTNWQKVVKELEPITRSAGTVVVTQGLQALYFLGDFDVVLNATVFGDIAKPGTVTAMDPRTGRRVIAGVEGLRDVIDCSSGGGVLIAHAAAWRNKSRVPNNVADFAESRMQRVELPEGLGFLVFTWSVDESPESPECERRTPTL